MPGGKKNVKGNKTPQKSMTKRGMKAKAVPSNRSKQTENSSAKEIKLKKNVTTTTVSPTEGRNEDEIENRKSLEEGEVDCGDLDMAVSPTQEREIFPDEEMDRREDNEENYDSQSTKEDSEADEREDERDKRRGSNNNATRIRSRSKSPATYEIERDNKIPTRKRERMQRLHNSADREIEEESDEQAKFLKKLVDILDQRDERKAAEAQRCQGGGDRETPSTKKAAVGPNRKERITSCPSDREEKRKTKIPQPSKPLSCNSRSDITLYRPAVEIIVNRQCPNREGSIDSTHQQFKGIMGNKADADEIRRVSSSSDEPMDTSDEHNSPQFNLQNNEIEPFISEDRSDRDDDRRQDELGHRYDTEYIRERQLQPHTSRRYPREEPTPDELLAKIVKMTERAKARILEVPGKNQRNLFDQQFSRDRDIHHHKEMIHSVLIDEGYSAVAGHVEDGIKSKILANEYIDFAKINSLRSRT